MRTTEKTLSQSLLATLAIALLGAAALAACGGGALGPEECDSEESCAAEDATMVEEKDPDMDPYKNCWRTGIDAPVAGLPSCEQVAREENNPYISK